MRRKFCIAKWFEGRHASTWSPIEEHTGFVRTCERLKKLQALLPGFRFGVFEGDRLVFDTALKDNKTLDAGTVILFPGHRGQGKVQG